MKSAVLLLFGAVALFGQDATGVIEGSVVNSVTGAGIEGATVRLSANSAPLYQAMTDATGSFRIAGIKPGEYRTSAQKLGFFGPATPFLLFRGGTSIHVDAGKDSPPLHFELTPPGRLRGRVIGVDKKPAARVEVALGPQYTTTATTNEEGVFVFENVDPGQRSLMTRVEHVRTYFPPHGIRRWLSPSLSPPGRIREVMKYGCRPLLLIGCAEWC
jgi:protocatechuate 3,4-dioxygenase beta subunit